MRVSSIADRAAEQALRRMSADDPGGRKPVVIAGPTASGKSALALRIAGALGGVIVNADALQVWSCWRVLSARPTSAEEAHIPHLLYGHRDPGMDYSVGHWLREVANILHGGVRPIIVGGTGLYLTALTAGLADIPATPADIRHEADRMLAEQGPGAMLADIDAATTAQIDTQNPVRVQRAWEVQRTTGRGLASWQAMTGAPLIAPAAAHLFVLDAERDWLARRIDARFDTMIHDGALTEVASVLPIWDQRAPWAKAIGAKELVAQLHGQTDSATAVAQAKAQSRQYAKRQRTWFRKHMRNWQHLEVSSTGNGDDL